MHPLLSRNLFYFRGERALAEGDPGALIRFALPVAGAVPTVYRFAPQETTLVQLMAQTEDGEPILRISGGPLDLNVYDEWDNPVGLVRRRLLTWKAEASLHDDARRELGRVQRRENRLALLEGQRERAVVTLHWKGERTYRGQHPVLDHLTLEIHHDQSPHAVIRPLMVAATATLLRRLSPKPVLSAAACPAF